MSGRMRQTSPTRCRRVTEDPCGNGQGSIGTDALIDLADNGRRFCGRPPSNFAFNLLIEVEGIHAPATRVDGCSGCSLPPTLVARPTTRCEHFFQSFRATERQSLTYEALRF